MRFQCFIGVLMVLQYKLSPFVKYFIVAYITKGLIRVTEFFFDTNLCSFRRDKLLNDYDANRKVRESVFSNYSPHLGRRIQWLTKQRNIEKPVRFEAIEVAILELLIVDPTGSIGKFGTVQ